MRVLLSGGMKTNNIIVSIEKKFESKLGTKVKIVGGKKKGKIEIEYYSEEDLERIGKILKI